MNNYDGKMRCPCCGGEWIKSPESGGYEKWKCQSCGTATLIKSEDDRTQMFEIGKFVDTMIKLAYNRDRSAKQSKQIEEWKNWEKNANIEKIRENYGGKIGEYPMFTMAYVAYLTYGFSTYKVKGQDSTENEAESLYKGVTEYLNDDSDSSKPTKALKEFAELYDKNLRSQAKIKKKRRRALLATLGGVAAACVVGAVVWMQMYAPSVSDTASGVNVSIPGNSLSLLEKLNLSVDVEQQPQSSVAYIDAKNALRNETEKFALYDISLNNAAGAVNLNGTVTVSMPIPSGYDTGALKVFYIASDETYEEMPSAVSLAQNTLSFETTHFSLYAIAERHPLVTFDPAGGNEVERQTVKRDTYAVAPDEPVRNGYTFAGWTLDGQRWDFSVDTVKKDITLVAGWVPNTYTVTFEANGGIGVCPPRGIPYMSEYGDLPSLTRPGYTFEGWYTAAEQGRKVTESTVMNTLGDHTLYAVFSLNTNKLAFNANGGEGDMSDFSLKSGESARLPACAYTRVGYTFVGWSTTMTGDTVYQDKAQYTMGTESTYTLYAQWAICSGVVKFNANGGEGTMESMSMNYAQRKPLEENTFTRQGYQFIGWSTEPAGKVVYVDRGMYTMGEESEYTLYAQWQKKTNKLYFNANGGSGSMHYIDVAYDAVATLPDNQFVRPGYTFIGWSFESVGTKAYDDGAEFKMGADDEYTLYAMWAGNSNRFTFYANGGEGSMPTDFTIATGEAGNLPNNRFTYTGYAFIGWSTERGGLVRYQDGALYAMSTTGDVSLYANWEAVAYTVTFESNGGSAIEDITYTVESGRIELPTPVRVGYIFDGWYDNGQFTGDTAESIEAGSYGDKAFYAKWHADTHTVAFDANGGEGYMDAMYILTDESDELLSNTFTKTGYTFVGWSEVRGGAVVYADGALYTMGTGERVTLYAVWHANTYTVTFDVNGGAESYEAMTVVYDADYNMTHAPTKTGYTFAGWYDGDTAYHSGVWAVAEDLTLTARWTANTDTAYTVNHYRENVDDDGYTLFETQNLTGTSDAVVTPAVNTYTGFVSPTAESVTVEADGSLVVNYYYDRALYTAGFVTDGGDPVNDITLKYQQVTTLPAPAKVGYTFAGWYEGDTPYGSTWTAERNLTLTARWTANIDTAYTVKHYQENADNDGYTLVETQNLTGTSDAVVTPAVNTYTGFVSPIAETVTISPDGSRVIEYRYARVRYTLSFVLNGGNSIDDITLKYQQVATVPTPVKAGYTFVGWYDVGALYGGSAWTAESNLTLTAHWTANTDTAYIVYHRLENLNDNGYTVVDTQNLTGTSDAVVTPAVNTYTGFVSPIAETVTISPDGSRVIEYRYARVRYTLSFVLNGGDRLNNVTAKYQQSVTVPTPTRTGYTFAGWYNGETPYNESTWTAEGNLTLTAHWTANTNTAYTVKHYQENANDDGYTLFDTQNLTGTSDTSVTPDVNTYTGFLSPVAQTATIAPDGTRVIEYYYARVIYTISLNLSEDQLDSTPQISNLTNTVKYSSLASEINYIPTAEGYAFAGWKTSTGVMLTDANGTICTNDAYGYITDGKWCITDNNQALHASWIRTTPNAEIITTTFSTSVYAESTYIGTANFSVTGIKVKYNGTYYIYGNAYYSGILGTTRFNDVDSLYFMNSSQNILMGGVLHWRSSYDDNNESGVAGWDKSCGFNVNSICYRVEEFGKDFAAKNETITMSITDICIAIGGSANDLDGVPEIITSTLTTDIYCEDQPCNTMVTFELMGVKVQYNGKYYLYGSAFYYNNPGGSGVFDVAWISLNSIDNKKILLGGTLYWSATKGDDNETGIAGYNKSYGSDLTSITYMVEDPRVDFVGRETIMISIAGICVQIGGDASTDTVTPTIKSTSFTTTIRCESTTTMETVVFDVIGFEANYNDVKTLYGNAFYSGNSSGTRFNDVGTLHLYSTSKNIYLGGTLHWCSSLGDNSESGIAGYYKSNSDSNHISYLQEDPGKDFAGNEFTAISITGICVAVNEP